MTIAALTENVSGGTATASARSSGGTAQNMRLTRLAYITGDNTIKVIHIPSGKSATLVIYDYDEWAACADEGVSFNANAKGERNIIIRGTEVPRDSYNSINDPALLRGILTGKFE
jgi:hypothetical protein